jgi:exopolysaccharide production protein ExoZ
MESVETKQKINSIQWLRGFASVIVLICHTNAASTDVLKVSAIPLAEYGINGVDIFFVISGFIMFLTTTANRRPFVPLDFMARRIIRIAPTYWLYSVLFFGLYFVLPQLFSRAVMTWPDLLMSIAFIPHYNAVGDLSPIIAIGWTLNFEMFFYIVFCTVRSRTRHIVMPIATVFLLIVAGGTAFSPTNAILNSFSQPILLEFVFGCFVAWIFVNKRRLPSFMTFFLILIGITLSLYLPNIIPDNGSTTALGYWRFAARGIPAALLVLAVTCGDIRDIWHVKPMLFLGDISYSLYLTHTLTLRVVFALYKHVQLTGMMSLLANILAIAIAIAAAVLAYVLIERPLTVALTKLYLRATSRGLPVAA